MSRKRTIRSEEQKPLVSTTMIIVVTAVAFLVVGGLVALGNWTQSQQDANLAEIQDLDNLPTKGDPNATVTMIDYSDFG